MSSSIRKDSGFTVLSIILIIVAIIVSIGTWSFSGQANTSTSSSLANVQAESIVKDAANIKLAYDKLILNGANYKNIIFMPNVSSTSSQPNVFDPVDGIAQPKVNKNFFSKAADGIYDRGEPYGIWTYSKTFAAPYIGDRLIYDPSILLAGLKDQICQQINLNLYGTTDIPLISGVAYASNFISGSTINNPNTTIPIASIFTPESMYRSQGCIRGNIPGENLYYLVLKPV